MKCTSFNWVKDDLEMVVDGVAILATAEGDCCSESWIEEVNMGCVTVPFRILGIEVTGGGELEDPHGDFPQEFTQNYIYQITTNKGVIDIELRNSSNGYYGGMLDVGGMSLDGWFRRQKGGQNV